MFKSNINTSIRHLFRNKGLSAINIFGLSVSIAICLLSYLYIHFEYSHDNFHKKGNRIYQLSNKTTYKGDHSSYNVLHNHKVATDLKRDIPEIEDIAGIRTCDGWLKYGDEKFQENIAFADTSFFNIFSFDFLIGSERTVLKHENEIFITKKFADKLINVKTTSDYSKLIGKTINFLDIKDKSLTIAGILNNIPKNSSIDFDIITSYKHSENYSQSRSDFGNTSIYLTLNSSNNKDNVEKTANDNILKYYGSTYREFVKWGLISDDSKNFRIELLKFNETYFSNKIKWSAYAKKGDKQKSMSLVYISILILILACVNYIMLSVGMSMKRYKEIAVRKVFGSKRKKIILQFITETGITVFISIALGVVIAELSLPFFNELSGFDLEFNLYTNIFAYTFLISLFTIIVSTISIPSIYISKLNPVNIFRNQTKMGSRLGMAKSFMLVQFTLSMILIIGSIFIIKQIHYMKDRDVCFDSQNIISVSIPLEVESSKTIRLQNRIMNHPNVSSVGGSDRDFISGSASNAVQVDSIEFRSRLLRVDTSYFTSLGIKILKGRNLRITDNIKNVNAAIVNETFANAIGVENPVGKTFNIFRSNCEIVGLVKDFHFESMHHKIKPLICFNGDKFNEISNLFVKTKNGKYSKTIKDINNIWNEFHSDFDLKYSILSDNLKQQYKSEERAFRIISSITLLALIISILGLIGLTMLLIMQKVKEIGIRKINGASTIQMLIMINKEFAKNLLIASAIAIPISYYGLSKWLENYAYKTPLSWWIFICCGVFLAIIVVATISYKAVRAASSNPIDAIRYE